MGVLTFPQKFRLLAESWTGFSPTSKDVARALQVNPSDLSRWWNGRTLNTNEPEARLVHALAEYFEEIKLLESRGIAKSEFIAMMNDSDDLAFLTMVKQKYSPLPKLVGIQSADALRAALRFRKGDILLNSSNERIFFLYRLGFNAGFDFDKREDKLVPLNGKSKSATQLVMRRIPARIRHADPQDEFLTYEEYYVDDLAEAGGDRVFTAIASAYVFRDFLTILSKDIRGEAGNLVEVSVAQVDLSSRSNGFFSGIISMRSDCSSDAERWDPTSYRIVLRTAPPGIPWDDEIGSDGKITRKGAKSLSRTVPITDLNKNQVIDESDFANVAVDEIDDGSGFARMFGRLNVVSNPADLLVSQSVNFLRKKRGQQVA